MSDELFSVRVPVPTRALLVERFGEELIAAIERDQNVKTRALVKAIIGVRIRLPQHQMLQLVVTLRHAMDQSGNFMLLDDVNCETGELKVGNVTFYCPEWPAQFFQPFRADS